MRRQLVALLCLTLPAWSGIFVRDQQYRFCANGGCEKIDCTKAKAPACNTPPPGFKLPVIENGPGYKISYLEYSEHGDRWDNAEFEVAKKLIEDERMANAAAGERYGGPITLVLYVHGWKNSANERAPNDPGDVEKFRKYLELYAKTFKPGLRRPIVGVYIGWHGRSLELPSWINWVSFWTRSAAALKVGKGELYKDFDVLVRIARQRGLTAAPEAQAQAASSDTPVEDPNRQSRVIVLSHSFGARVLQTALIGLEPSHGDIPGVCKSLALHGIPQRPPVDLILFENAATGAGAVWRQFNNCQPCGRKTVGCSDTELSSTDFSRAVMVRSPGFDRFVCRDHPEDDRCQPYPLLVSVSAKNDLLTRIVLFFASAEHPAPFLPWLQTHKVNEVSESEAVINHAKGQIFSFEGLVSGRKRTYIVERKRDRHIAPVNAIWTMKVDKEIINEHGDVWNKSFLNFQINLISSTDRTKGREHQTFSEPLNRVTQPMCPDEICTK